MRRFWLAAFLLSPIFVVGLLFWLMGVLLQKPPAMNAPPVGAGAGVTGGANAIGELLAGGKANSTLGFGGPEHMGRSGAEAAAAAAVGANSDKEDSADAKADSKLVQPESLPQGFILLVTDNARLATQTSPIFLASNHFGNWSPGDPNYKLTAQSDMKWRIDLPQPPAWKDSPANAARLEFKFARGSWDLEELNDNLQPVTNRTLPPIDASKLKAGEKPIIEISIAKWGDQRPDFKLRQFSDPYRTTQATGTLRRMQVRGGGGSAASLQRDLLVWLPSGYDDKANAGVTYPVLYLMDAQNLFEGVPGAREEWRVDETMTDLISKGTIGATIIVGVPHAGAGRIQEYLPPLPGAPKVAGVERGHGDEFIAWMRREVMPRVERGFRVKTGPENTGIGGSSLGGAIALYAGSRHPEVFGMVLAESPSLTLSGYDVVGQVFGGVKQWPGKVYIGMGGKEMGGEADKAAGNDGLVKAANALRDVIAKNSPATKLKLEIDAAANHNEAAWAKRFPAAATFLLGK